MPVDDPGMDAVWTHVDRELARRRLKWAWLARELEMSDQQVNNWKRRRVPPEQYPRIAALLGITIEQLLLEGDAPTGMQVRHEIDPRHADGVRYAGRPRAPQRIPVQGTAKMGQDGRFFEIEYPDGGGGGFVEAYSADGDAYAMRVRGDGMHPAIKHGQVVVVEPAGACVPGENVLIALRDGRRMIRELVATRQDSITVLSVNSGERDTYERRDVDYVHSVAGVFSSSKWRPE